MICQNLYYFCPPTGRGAAMMPALVREGRIDWFRYALSGPFGGISGRFFHHVLARLHAVVAVGSGDAHAAQGDPSGGASARGGASGALELGSAAEGGHADGARRDRHRGQPFPLAPGIRLGRDRPALDENREGKRLRGGSTISQQTAKNVFCLPARTWLRKGVEAWFTVLIETFWSKRRIMEVYLNVIETGRNMYGVEAPAATCTARLPPS